VNARVSDVFSVSETAGAICSEDTFGPASATRSVRDDVEFFLPSGDAEGPDAEAEVRPGSDWPGFDEFDLYSEVFDPCVDESPVCGALSDDVLDIYADLRRGLVTYDEGRLGSAVWEWEFHFDHHWGQHAVDALRALRRACLRWKTVHS